MCYSLVSDEEEIRYIAYLSNLYVCNGAGQYRSQVKCKEIMSRYYITTLYYIYYC